MRVQGLKTKLTVNLTFFFLLAIVLTDFVVVRIVEKNLIQQRIKQGRQVAAYLSQNFQPSHPPILQKNQIMNNLYQKTDLPFLVHAVISSQDGSSFFFGQKPPEMGSDPIVSNRRTMQSGKSQKLFLGTTWGVFWKQHRYIAVTTPLLKPSDVAGAATVIIRLEDIYQTLQNSQKMVAFYSLINLFVLLGLIRFRLNRILLRPIHKFIKMTEQVQSSDQFPVYQGQRDNEFGQLSNAIQQMARRIEADKEQIEVSLNSLKIAHNDLKAAQKEIIRAEKLASVGRLSAGVAHEIGNPISIVLGYLSILKKQPGVQGDNLSVDYIDRAEKEINRINQIIRQLLDFSRPSPGEKQIVSAHMLIRDVARMLCDQPLMRNIDLSCLLQANKDQIYVDQQQLRQVLVNLIINAADSIGFSKSAEAGKIELQTRDMPANASAAVNKSASLEITVSDNGDGIAEKDIDNIFDPFYTTKDPGKGTGLGLSVSYMIIEQFGGIIDAKSERHKGTTMSVYLPLSAET